MSRTTTTKKTAARKSARGTTLSMRAMRGIAALKPVRGPVAPGLSVPRFATMVKASRMGLPVWSGALHVSVGTLEKRMERKDAFSPLEADRLLMVEQVLERGLDVFEDADDLRLWLQRKHPLLGNRRPMDLLGSTPGIGLVMMELGRIEHGVY